MNKTTPFYQIIEDLRLKKNVSIDELCDGIVSTRTYYRYLNNEITIRCLTFYKLLERLHVNISELKAYFTHFSDCSIHNITSVIFNSVYNNKVNLNSTLEELKRDYPGKKAVNALLDGLIVKKEYETKQISTSAYIEKLESILKSLRDNEIKDSCYLFIFALLFSVNHKNSLLNISTLFNADICLIHYFDSLLILISLDILLSKYITLTYVDKCIFTTAYSKFKYLLPYFNVKVVYANARLYEAYFHQLNGEQDLCINCLTMYFSSISALRLDERFEEKRETAEKIFKIDMYNVFQKNKALRLDTDGYYKI